jgi:abortive infection bacteriophage resistance protein
VNQQSGPAPYDKPWLDYPEQLQLLVTRGLTVADRRAAESFLAHVNYFRFSGYCLAFEKTRHSFYPGVTFEDVRRAYAFDIALRDLLTEALEVVEIDFRTCMAYHFGKEYGAFGHTEPRNFYGGHERLMKEILQETERSKETFVAHCERSYTQFPDLPIWILT